MDYYISMFNDNKTLITIISIIAVIFILNNITDRINHRRLVNIERKKIRKRTDYFSGLLNRGEWANAETFIHELDERHVPDFKGVYLIYNNERKMYYVGQSVRVLSRVKSHLLGQGSGNSDIYADRKYGSTFNVKLLPLNGSGFNNLDDMERHYISATNAYENGYNKTRGNGG